MKVVKDVFAFVFGDDPRLTVFAVAALLVVFRFRDAAAAWLILPVLLATALCVSVSWKRRV